MISRGINIFNALAFSVMQMSQQPLFMMQDNQVTPLSMQLMQSAHRVGITEASLDICLFCDQCHGRKAVTCFGPHAHEDKSATPRQGLHASLRSTMAGSTISK